MHDFDAIVIGAGHNGLVCAAYLARGGLRTLLLEARTSVGGTASSERFGGGVVNICNCDHITFRTTPISDELDLAAHGLRYIDLDPSQVNLTWDGSPAWASYHSVERTLESIARSHPSEVDGYRRYVRAAVPAMRLVLEAANDAPTMHGLIGTVIRRGGRGATTLLRWSRRSAADMMRSFFSTDALQAPGLLVGPMVWGISPEFPSTGLGALTYGLRHVGTVGRPVGGSGMVTDAILAAFTAAGGQLRTASPVASITCEGPCVRGVRLADGTEITAPRVISACNPHDTFLQWLTNPPAQARDLIDRWRSIPHDDGYESKIDAITTSVPHLRAAEAGGLTGDIAASYAIAPSIAEMHRGYSLMARGEVLEQPGMIANVPSVDDSTLTPAGHHVLSLEVLYTPYAHPGGWPNSSEPTRWLDRFSALAQPDFRSSILEWRAMTPDRYEREFHLPHGHATSFAGGPLAAFKNPNPELTSYSTAVDGLYLTGAATFPGAGVWGASGRNAAHVVLRRA